MCQDTQKHAELDCIYDDPDFAEFITPEDRKLNEAMKLANERKFKEAIERLTEVYQQKNDLAARSDAAVCLSDLYSQGLGVVQDQKRARQLLEDALEQGTDFERWAEACLNLAIYCEEGWGGAQNLQRAKQFYEIATWEDESWVAASASLHLGMMYYRGKGIPQNNFVALAYLKNAFVSEEDHASFTAANILSEMYFVGAAGPRDIIAAESYAQYVLDDEIASDFMKAQAAERLGLFQYAQQEFKKARSSFEQANKYREDDASFSGNVNYFLGAIYAIGQGCKRDAKKALPLLERVANSDHERWTAAAFQLGVINYFGFGVPVDYAIAADYFNQVCTNSDIPVIHAAASAFLGMMVYEGQGMEKSEARAQRFFHEAHFDRHSFQEPDLQIPEAQKLFGKAMKLSGIVQ